MTCVYGGHMKKKKNRRRWIIFAVIAVIAVLIYSSLGNSGSAYAEVQAQRRDISAYNSFTGNVEASSDTSVYPKVSSTVESVMVKEGDTVTAGQVLFTLDSSEAEYNVNLQSAQVSQTDAQASGTVKDAQTQYDNYKSSLDQGLNQSLMSAQTAKDNAWNAWQNAKQALDDAKSGNSSAKSSAQTALNNAQGVYDQAAEAYTAVQDEADALKKAYEDAAAEDDAAKAAKEVQDAVCAAAQSAYDNAAEDQKAALEETLNTEKQKKSDADLRFVNAENALAQAKEAYESSGMDSVYAAYVNAQTALQSAQAAYNAAGNADISALEKQVKSTEDAWNNANAGYEAVKKQVDEQLASLASSVDKAKVSANTTASHLQLDHLKESLDDYTVTAPTSGVVSKLNVNAGDLVSSAQASAVISDTGSMKAQIKIDEYSITRVNAGNAVTVYVNATGDTFEGTIDSVAESATVSQGVSYYLADVKFPADASLRQGMSVEVRLTTVDEKNVISLPAEAVSYHDDNTAYVMVKNGNSYEEKAVTIGASDGTYVEITDGLEEGESVYYTPTTMTMTETRQQMMEQDAEGGPDDSAE